MRENKPDLNGITITNDPDLIFAVIDNASKRYKGAIPEDCYHEPYMPMDELLAEMKRMQFYGYWENGRLLGVMAKEPVKDVTLIRHAYVMMNRQGRGIGSKLLRLIEERVETDWLLIGTWTDAVWAIDFYRKHGYEMMPEKDDLLLKYWVISERQRETSCVLGKRIQT